MSGEQPLVSICCITYNHVQYIRRAIEGFLMQKTNFAFEILIHDDASSDGTSEIIKEYQQRFPELIYPIFQTENQYSKGIRTSLLNLKRAVGHYIALCEGDDYWIDPFKLQKQFDFMTNNHDFSMVFTGCEIHKFIGGKRRYTYQGFTRISPDDYLEKNPFIATASIFFVRSLIPITYSENWMLKSFAGDLVVKYCALANGDLGFIPDVTCVYNCGIPGSWSSQKYTKKKILKEFSDEIRGINYLTRHRPVRQSAIAYKIKIHRSISYNKYSVMLGGFSGLFYLLFKFPHVTLRSIGSYVKTKLNLLIRYSPTKKL